MGEDNTKASYSRMFKLRICYSVNEQKPLNSNLQEKYYRLHDLLSVHPYFLPFKNLYKNKKKKNIFSSSSLLFHPLLCRHSCCAAAHCTYSGN